MTPLNDAILLSGIAVAVRLAFHTGSGPVRHRLQ
jgi:hypothetical protein